MNRQKRLQLCLDCLPPCYDKKRSELSIRRCREEHDICPICGKNEQFECPILLPSKYIEECHLKTK